jgi:uncharacterized protein (TIGR03437 family)
LGLARTAAESIVEAASCQGGFFPHIDDSFKGDPRNPPTVLGGTTVTVTDSAGVERLAPILALWWANVSYIVPAGTSNGLATVVVRSSDGYAGKGYLDVRTVAPAPFGLSPYVSGYVVRVRDGAQTVESSYELCRNGWWCLSVDMGAETDQVYLVILTTGLRNRSSLDNVKVLIGDVEVRAEYAGPQFERAGIDQINLKLPRSLAGRGYLVLQMTLDGNPDNVPGSESFIFVDIK